jgi:hypothetical protein
MEGSTGSVADSQDGWLSEKPERQSAALHLRSISPEVACHQESIMTKNIESLAQNAVYDHLVRLEGRLDYATYEYDYANSRYVHSAYDRQGAEALGREIAQARRLLADGLYVESGAVRQKIADAWNSRDDWRAGARAAGVLRDVEKVVGL